MWADIETDVDFLNYSEVAELVAEMIANKELLPLSLGIFGGWGMGKSSTLRLVERELAGKPDQYLIIKFDAWLYQDFDDARAALMSVIASQLIEAVPPTVVGKAKSLFKRVNKLRALGLLAEGGAALMGVPTFGLLSRGLVSLDDAFAGKADEDDAKTLKEAVGDAKERASGLLRPAETNEPPEEIAAFRKEFGEVLSGLGRTLVVFIDNLDRCLPENAIHTLEAIRLFLFMPNTAFVIAADEDMIRHAVAKHFENPGERHIADYLDKLIQMPVHVPRAGIQEVRAYLFLLLVGSVGPRGESLEKLRNYLVERLQLAWKDNENFDVEKVLELADRKNDDTLRFSLEMADRMAPMLATASRVQGNPRIVKRLLNVVRMRASIARKRKMPLDEAIIAKLALFERCTDSGVTEGLHNAISAAPGGKPDLLTKIEAAKTEDDVRKIVPDPWQKHVGFIYEWTRLDPKLAGVDLRSAVYLARETVPMRFVGLSVPPRAIQTAQILLQTATISSRVAADAIAKLEGGEAVATMDLLVSEMRKNPTWDRARSDFRGAFLLARASPQSAMILARFIRTLPSQPPWMKNLIKDEGWLEE